MELLRDLGANDPGLLFVVGMLFGAAFGVTFLAVGAAWDRRPVRPRGESLSERHDRLDAEALAQTLAATRPATSNRKSGRTRGAL